MYSLAAAPTTTRASAIRNSRAALTSCVRPVAGTIRSAITSYDRTDSTASGVRWSLVPGLPKPSTWSRTPSDSLSSGVQAKASASPSAATPGDNQDSGKKAIITFVGGLVLLGLAVAGLLSTPHGMSVKEALVNGPLGKSGFLAAFSLIFLSEIGDKTFFIAALLAMKLGKWVSFAGSLASLAIMTVISVGIGVVIGKAPDALKSSVPVGEILGCVMLVFFGVKALREGLKAEEGNSGQDEEMAEADEAVKQAEQGGKVRRDSGWFQAFMQVATLIFIAEWGDRSMLATIALGAAQNAFGVAAGAITGHAIATGIAVVGGALTAQHISERQINLVSGALFLVFAVATAWNLLV